MEWRKGDKVTPGAVFKGQNRNGSHGGAPRAPSPTRNRAAYSRSTSAMRCCRSRTGATTSSPPTAAAARSPNERGIADPAGSARPRGSAPGSRPRRRQRRAHQVDVAAAEGEGRGRVWIKGRADDLRWGSRPRCRGGCRSSDEVTRRLGDGPSHTGGGGEDRAARRRPRWVGGRPKRARACRRSCRRRRRSVTSWPGHGPHASPRPCMPGTCCARPASAAARAPSSASDGPPTAARSRVWLVQNQIGQGTARQVRRGDTVADISTGPTQSGGLVERDACRPVPRHRQHATPAVRDRDVADLRQHIAQRRGQVRDRPFGHPPVDVGARCVAVRHAAAADRDAVVDGALRVEEAVCGVAEGFAATPADASPKRRRRSDRWRSSNCSSAATGGAVRAVRR